MYAETSDTDKLLKTMMMMMYVCMYVNRNVSSIDRFEPRRKDYFDEALAGLLRSHMLTDGMRFSAYRNKAPLDLMVTLSALVGIAALITG